MIISEVTNAYVVPYVLTLVYEGSEYSASLSLSPYADIHLVTLTISLIRITRWRKRIPKRIRAPLLDALWRDGKLVFEIIDLPSHDPFALGVFYFSWTLGETISLTLISPRLIHHHF